MSSAINITKIYSNYSELIFHTTRNKPLIVGNLFFLFAPTITRNYLVIVFDAWSKRGKTSDFHIKVVKTNYNMVVIIIYIITNK